MSTPASFPSLHRPAGAFATAPARRAAALALYRASLTLARLSLRLQVPSVAAPKASPAPRVEFHAEAGAPEGALYVDGMLVATLPGVTRL